MVAEHAADFGVELRRRRLERGFSLAALAKQVHYTKGYLSKVENGSKYASRELARRCDAALRARGSLAALVPGTSENGGTGANRTLAGTDGNGSGAGEVAAGGGAGAGQQRAADDAELVVGDLTVAVTADGQCSVRLGEMAGPVSAQVCVGLPGEQVVAAFQEMFTVLRGLGQHTAPGVLLPSLAVQTQTLASLATAGGAPAGGGTARGSRRELFEIGARYAEYTGWMAQEAGLDDAALHWTETAVDLARLAGDRDMATYALVRRALLALYRDDPAETVRLARLAASSDATPARIRLLAAQREAQGHSAAGDYDACFEALDRAAALAETAGEQVASASGSGVQYGSRNLADPAAMAVGWCLYDLGELRRATEVLDRETARLPAGASRIRARFGARRALAYAALGEVDRACELTWEVLGSARAVDSATIRTDLRRLRRTLRRWHSHGSVRDVLPDLGRASRPAAPPARR